MMMGELLHIYKFPFSIILVVRQEQWKLGGWMQKSLKSLNYMCCWILRRSNLISSKNSNLKKYIYKFILVSYNLVYKSFLFFSIYTNLLRQLSSNITDAEIDKQIEEHFVKWFHHQVCYFILYSNIKV